MRASDLDPNEERPLGERVLPEELMEPAEDVGRKPDRAAANLVGYLREISRIPRLGLEEEQSLARRVQAGDREAERRMIEASLRLVFNIARRYRHRDLPLPDLVEEGNLGLMKAVRKFRPDRGTRFSTYATWWIRQAVVEALATQARTIRLPVHVEVLLARYRKEAERLSRELGRPPSREEVAQALEISLEQLAELEKIRQPPAALDAALRDGGHATLGDVLPDPSPSVADTFGGFLRESADLAGLLDDLPERERTVIRLRFGLGGEEPLTLPAIGGRLGLTRERVRQIEAAGLARLRAFLKARGIDPSDPFP